MPNPPHETPQSATNLTETSSVVELADSPTCQAWLHTAIVKDLTTRIGLTPVTNLQPRSRWAQENLAKAREQGLAEGQAKGRAKGIATSVLRVLDHRRLELSSEARAHIAACTDIDLAKTWLDEALSITDVSQLTDVLEG